MAIMILCLLLAAACIGALWKIHLKTPFKIAVIVALVLSVLFGLRAAMTDGLLPTPGIVKALVPQKTQNFSGNVGGPVASYDIPAAPVANSGPVLTVLSIPWNAVSSLTVANGGATTATDSLVTKYSGLKLNIQNQGDYSVQKDQLVKFAQGWKNGDASQGAAFTVMMGDQFVAYERSVHDRLSALGQKIAVVGISGFSYGEDKCMGKALNGNPQNAKGSLIAAVPYDGDWDVCVKWASDNGIKINQDNTTFDADAINFMDTTSFDEADQKFIAGACEDRIVVKNGVKTSEKKHVCLDGVATWTPGDVTVAQQKGGVTTWASTRDYNQQMPAVLIGNVDYMNKNRAAVVGLLRAMDRASFQIRGGDMAKLGKANAAIFGTGGGQEANPEFWIKYFNSVDGKDAQGATINLGGSRVVGLAETKDFMGLTPGSLNIYKGIYGVYCDYDKTFFPKDVPSCSKYEDVVDTSYVTAALQGVNVAATKAAFTEQKSITSAVSSRSYALVFDTGKTTLTSASMKTLNDIANSAAQTGLRIRIAGHTDNTGNSTANLALSRGRAKSVADALTALAPNTFPAERMEVQGFGDMNPVADNATEPGRAKNRRVEITLGK
jgi:OOP family OmpA-OmpF porin